MSAVSGASCSGVGAPQRGCEGTRAGGAAGGCTTQAAAPLAGGTAVATAVAPARTAHPQLLPEPATAAAPAGTSSGSAALPRPSAQGGGAGAGAAAGPTATAAAALASIAAAAEQQLTALRLEGERAGNTLRGVPDAQLQAAKTAVKSLEGRISSFCSNLLYDRSKLWAAALQVHAMALRDAVLASQPEEELLVELCLLLLTASSMWRTVTVAADAQQGRARDAAVVAAVRLSLALLQTDTLQAHARVLAQRRTALLAAMETYQAGGVEAVSVAALQLCAAAHRVKNSSCNAVFDILAAVSPLRSGAEVGESPCTNLKRQLQSALVGALHASNVLEHLARLRMELQRADRLLADSPQLPDAHNPFRAELDYVIAQALGSLWVAEPRAGLLLRLSSAPTVSGDGRTDTLLKLQLRSLARQPCLQLWAGWRLAAHLCHEAGAQLFGMPDSLVPVDPLSEEQRMESVRCAAVLWSWALCAPPDGSGAAGAAAAQGSAPQPLPPLPYKPVHMIRLLCGALPSSGQGVTPDICASIALVCYRALVHHPMPPAEAEAMLRDVWPRIVATLRQSPCQLASVSGQLLRLTPGAAAALAPAVGPALPLPLSLRCALEAGLLRGVEGCLRRAVREAVAEAAGGSCTAQAADCSSVLETLRWPGIWPAVLAAAPPRQVAALVVTLRKVLVVSKKQPLMSGLAEHCDIRLRALLEQAAAAVVCAAPSIAGSLAAGASCITDRFRALADACRSLQLNRLVVTNMHVCDSEAARTPPDLALLARLGAYPAPGSPAAQQQLALAVLAAAQWLPALLGWGEMDVGQSITQPWASDARDRPIVVWLSVAAQECLRARWAAEEEQQQQQRRQQQACRHRRAGPSSGDSGSGNAVAEPWPSESEAYASWRGLICTQLRVNAVLLSVLVTGNAELQCMGATSRDALLDVLGLTVAAAPDDAAHALQPDGLLAALMSDGQVGARARRFLQQQGRMGLWEALGNLRTAAQCRSLPPGWQPPEQLLLPDAAHLPAATPLPPPCLAAGVLPLCSYPCCTAFDGESEADATLRVCGRCRAVRYCSQACQRAHWAAGHKAECAGGSARG